MKPKQKRYRRKEGKDERKEREREERDAGRAEVVPSTRSSSGRRDADKEDRERERGRLFGREKKKPAGQIALSVSRRTISMQKMRAKRVVFCGAQSDAEDDYDREEDEFNDENEE
tara:strand:- start:112 stop:456 length:345 start_codon:yes stop_codon:yes gene_type:complete